MSKLFQALRIALNVRVFSGCEGGGGTSWHWVWYAEL
jgi:hypothetical protein